ncbi:hypothetical protein Btru_001797 [Bulinus truncatus]|nr:hypothetical protein Btru_001797 [Bulinus truncatus]
MGCPGQSSNVNDEARVQWAEAYIVVYSVLERSYFLKAKSLADLVMSVRQSSSVPLILLGNKADLDPGREVTAQEGRQMAQDLRCLHREVSAAEDLDGSVSAFQSLIREAFMYKHSLTKRRKNSLGNVSKKLGAMFGKKDANNFTKQDGTGNLRNSWTEVTL